MAKFGGLVVIKTQMHPERNIRIRQRIGKIQFSGRIVNRIAAKDEQHLDFARPHVRNEVFDRLRLIYRIGIHRIGIDDRFPPTLPSA